ncbi:MAG TPA: gliding motility-associated C-terminal domain-containing protein [Bacteroidia bacterium]
MKLNKVVFSLFFGLIFGMEVSGQCGTAFISSDDTIVCVPKIVRFKINKFPAGTTFEWDLGSGYVNSDSTYTKLYSVSGVYNVRVKLKYLDGSTCVLDKSNFIQAKPVPIPQFTVSKTVICNYKDSILITDVTSKTVSRDWLIDNTLYSNGPKSIMAMFRPPTGLKSFTIFMKDSFGCEGKKTFDDAVLLPDSISVDFTSDKSVGCIPKLVSFTSLTDTLGYKISSWNWLFPGASPSSSNKKHPTGIVYNSKDTFDVTLRITTDRGCVYEKSEKDFLMFADSTVLNVSFNKTLLCGSEDLIVTLNNGRSSDPVFDVTPLDYNRTIINPNKHKFKFTNFGNYSVHVKDDINGCVSEKEFKNLIAINGPIAGFNIPNNISCLKPDTFTVFDTSRVNSGVSKTYRWDVYDVANPNLSVYNTTGSPANLVCSNSGTYSVRLIVTGSNGCKDTLRKNSILEIKKIEPNFRWIPVPACPIEQMQFENRTPRGTSKAVNKYTWTFYNLSNGVIKRDSATNPVISYPDTGHYTVKLVAYNKLGCKDSITLTKKIVVERPIPKFRITDSLSCNNRFVGLKVLYKDSAYYQSYHHRWFFQHTDSVNINYVFDGDSVRVNLLPGMYNIRYNRFSNRNTCFDTLKVPFRLKISGVNFQATINPIKVCNPYTATLTAIKTNSYNFYNNITAPITNNWSHEYDTNKVAIRQPSKNPSPVVIKKSGYFSFKFKYTHPSGCNDSSNTTTMTSGVVANYMPNLNSYYACVGKPLALFNRSDKDAVAYKWFVKDSGSGAVFLPSATAKDPKVVFGNSGIFKLGLIAYGNGNCTDTIINAIYSNNIKAQFSSVDTLNYCAPIIARINAVRHPAIIEYRWYMGNGDSITNNISTFGYLYKSNTGPEGSDVKLVVRAYGCNDTSDRKGFIKVIGPIPKFNLTNNIGCEKLKVKFNNESKYYKRFFLEYGDGSVLDSVNFNFHTYQIYDRSLPYQRFKPTLSVIDSFGCIVQYEKDTVFVLKSPEPKFSVNNDTGCANLNVQFRNTTVGGVTYKWDFDGNGTIDNTSFAPRYSYPDGDFNPVMIAKASNGCEDTARNQVFIKSYKRPDVSFAVSSDTICYNEAITFTGNNVPNNADVVDWIWDFGDPNTFKDTAYTRVAKFNFKRILLSQVMLLVKDKNGCTDTSARFIYTNDTIGPKSTPMNYITVSNNQFIDINWGKSKFKDYTAYHLYNDNSPNFNLLYTTANIVDTTFRVSNGIDVNGTRYCFNIKTKDKCNNLGSFTLSHCSILLQIRDTAQNDLILDWLPYEGWGLGNVRRYRIYRSDAGGKFNLLDSVSGNTTSYRDKKLCTKVYCYYIEAVEKNNKWVSKSNTVCKTPLYIYPSVAVNSTRTTVLSSNQTYTQWSPYKFVKNVDHYIVSRSSLGSGKDFDYAQVDSSGFIDKDPYLETNKKSYTYTVRAVDHCGAESPESPVNTTILLGGKSEGYTAKLNWSEYNKWFSGVKKYQIYIRENNTFKVIGTIDTASSLYEFDFPDTELDDSICFKIQAIKDTSELIESFSNVLCLISDAKIFIPNAFTPNNDGKNDVFIPRAILIFNQTGNPILDYELEIFNRWGERVFFTNDVNQGWDGVYNGEVCQQGQYIYRVRALALDGVTAFNLEGSFVLLR